MTESPNEICMRCDGTLIALIGMGWHEVNNEALGVDARNSCRL
jgi:hypothetical protein